MTCCCGAGGSTPHGSAASTTGHWPLIWYAWPWRWAIATSLSRWPAPSRPVLPWRRRCRRCAAWRCAARDWSTARPSWRWRRSRSPGGRRCWSSTPAPARTRRSCWPGAGGGTRQWRCWLRHWNATSRRGPGAVAGPGRASCPARVQAPAGGGLGEPDRDRAGGVAAGGRGTDERCGGQAAVHVAAYREHPPPARVRQAGRIEPGCARRRGPSLDRVMSSPLAASTIGRSSNACYGHELGRATVDHAVTMRSTYERINKGDIAGFGDLVAEGFVEHQGAGGPGFPPTKEGTLEFFRTLLAAFPDWRMTVEDLIAGGDKTVARVTVTG